MGYNSVTLYGRLTRDPELSYSPDGKAYARGGIAFGDSNKKGFANFVLFGKSAEMITKSARKGHRMLLEGRLDPDENGSPKIWGDTPRASYDIIVNNFTFVETRADAGVDDSTPQEGGVPF